MQIPVDTSPTTQALIDAVKAGKVTKSADRTTLVDQQGKVVATRLAALGDTDYYADAQQKFSDSALGSICISFNHPSVSICICVRWGDQIAA